MNFKTTRKEFELSDPSGYSFHVTLTYDAETGWDAHVSMSAYGMKTDKAALKRLTETVQEFVRMATAPTRTCKDCEGKGWIDEECESAIAGYTVDSNIKPICDTCEGAGKT